MEVSFFEMIAVLAIGFLVLGPKDLVKYSHILGRWMAKIRTEINNFRVLAEEEILKGENPAQTFIEEKKAIEDKVTEMTNVDIKKDDSNNNG